MARSRSLANALARLLDASSLPVYALDEQRRIVYGNAALFAWLAADPQELIGLRCDYHSGPEAGPLEQIAARICPPPEVFQGQRVDGQVACQRSEGQLSRRRAAFLPLGSDPLELVGVLAIVAGVDLPEQPPELAPPVNPAPAELHQRLIELRQQMVARFGIERLVGDSLQMQRIRQQVRVAHQAQANTVVFGPPGSGREHIARTIHYGDDPQKAGRLLPVACSLMDADLLRATIATILRDARASRGGVRSTLLLLEVDQLPATAQRELVGLLRLPDFQLATVATARSDLLELAADGRFERDLAAMLSTMVIQLPPLAERPEDVALLAQAFLERFNAEGGRQLSGFSSEALNQLTQYPWPGNVDELAETVDEACRQADGPLVELADLPQRIHLAARAAAHPREPEETIVLDEFLAEIESQLIRRAMRRAKGNKAKAARLLGVTRPRLLRRLEQMGWDIERDLAADP